MITAKKISIYRKYDGDIDTWARFGGFKDKRIMSDHDWHDIDELQRRLRLIKNGLASEDFEMQTKMMLDERVENEEVVRMLRECA